MSKRKNSPKRVALNHDLDGILAHEDIGDGVGASIRPFTVSRLTTATKSGFEKLVAFMVNGQWTWVHKDFRV